MGARSIALESPRQVDSPASIGTLIGSSLTVHRVAVLRLAVERVRSKLGHDLCRRASAKMRPVVCADCGYLRYFVDAEALGKLRSSEHRHRV